MLHHATMPCHAVSHCTVSHRAMSHRAVPWQSPAAEAMPAWPAQLSPHAATSQDDASKFTSSSPSKKKPQCKFVALIRASQQTTVKINGVAPIQGVGMSLATAGCRSDGAAFAPKWLQLEKCV